MTSAGYLRFPHLHQDLVTFVSENDVWLGPVEGGRAWRVSADQTPASHPRISADGSLIAWNSTKDGQSEVYLAAADGGDQRRLTYWGDPYTRVTGWTPDGDVLAVSATGQPFGQNCWAYAIPATAPDRRQDANGRAPAGEPAAAGAHGARRLPLGPLADVAMRPGAIALLHGLGRDPAAWKRYRGGTAGRLWVAPSADGRTADGPFTRVLASLGSQLACPMVAGGRLAFLSDHEGTGNVYSCALDGTGLRRHTDHDGFYARNASTDGSRIVYHCAGDLWLLDSLDPDSQPRRLEAHPRLGGPGPGPPGHLGRDPPGRPELRLHRPRQRRRGPRHDPLADPQGRPGPRPVGDLRGPRPDAAGGGRQRPGGLGDRRRGRGRDRDRPGRRPAGRPDRGQPERQQRHRRPGQHRPGQHRPGQHRPGSTGQASTGQGSTGQASDSATSAPAGGGGLRRLAAGAVGRVASMSASPTASRWP